MGPGSPDSKHKDSLLRAVVLTPRRMDGQTDRQGEQRKAQS